jgi:chaperonin cofactor prefoldin
MTADELEKRLRFLEKRVEELLSKTQRQARVIMMLMEKIKDVIAH